MSLDLTVNSQPEIRTFEIKSHVGIDSLPDQLVKKRKTQGYCFNVLCVGETGIGKSTLMESLFNMPLGTANILRHFLDVVEGDARVRLTIVETAGYGDQLDKQSSANVIAEYINKQYELYLKEELKIQRNMNTYQDTRIHACLYFISPTGHGLKVVDVVTMQKLSNLVNVIPVVAKSDMASKEELKRFKTKIMSELEAKGVHFYRFPEDDEATKKINAPLNVCMPFAVVGSTHFVMEGKGASTNLMTMFTKV